ncbi:MAG: glycosyltransferase [Deltaproteobacteria bacterium]|nr:glycosyltransferase [Deltaproteobacteria bacterium]
MNNSANQEEEPREIANLKKRIKDLELCNLQLDNKLDIFQRRLIALTNLLDNIERSLWWRFLRFYQTLLNKVIPTTCSLRAYYDRLILWEQAFFSKTFPRLTFYELIYCNDNSYEKPYQRWISLFEPKTRDLKKQKLYHFSYNPLISIVMPIYKPPLKYLKKAIDSVINQTYSNWELCIANASPEDMELSVFLNELTSKDGRVKIVNLESNLGISNNTNKAISITNGQYIGFLDQDDELALFALHEVVKVLNIKKDVQVLYSDEDKITEEGKRFDPFMKPDFSLSLLECINYITHFVIVRRDIGDSLNWLRSEFDGSQDYDLLLQLALATNDFYHIDKVLYHWRIIEGSAAGDPTAKLFAHSAAISAIDDYALAHKIPYKVVKDDTSGLIYMNYPVTDQGISIVIANKDKAEYLSPCVHSLITNYDLHYLEIIIVDHDSNETDTKKLYAELAATFPNQIRIVAYSGEFNYSILNNLGVQHARHENLLFLNNDTKVISNNFLKELTAINQQADVGAIGPLLLYKNDSVQSAGLALINKNPHIISFAQGSCVDDEGYKNLLKYRREVSALTGACLMTKRSVFFDSGKFDTSFASDFNDVEYCLRLRFKGYKIVWTPFARGYHYESISRASLNSSSTQLKSAADLNNLMRRWPQYFQTNDPYLPHLSKLSYL